MPIHSLKLTNIGPFRHRPDGSGSDGIKLEFDVNVNLLIGTNNVGKSTILQALALTAGGDSVRQCLPANYEKTLYEWPGGVYPRFTIQWANYFGEPRTLDGRLTGFFDAGSLFIAIGDTGDAEEIEYHGEGRVKVETLRRELSYVGYYNPAILQPANGYYKGRNGPSNPIADSVVREITKEFQLDIFGERFQDYDLSDETGADEWRLGLEKIGTPDGHVTPEELSHGTGSVLEWVRQFASGMERFEQGVVGWNQMPGIFIIDEIDAHLHSSWQRRIIPTLTRHFPNVQIFASTHSPMMVAGLKAGQVHLLKRDESGRVVWSRNERDIIGWTADEIYRTFMGIDDPTDESTARHAEELRELRNKDSLTPEDEERLEELRRLVNQDLLARGALNAQQERFDAMMQEYLRSRASDLSQDGA